MYTRIIIFNNNITREYDVIPRNTGTAVEMYSSTGVLFLENAYRLPGR